MRFYRTAIVDIRVRNNTFDGYTDFIPIRGLRVAFSIVKSLSRTTNSAVVKIWNMSQNHRNIIKDFGDRVTIYAGYEIENGSIAGPSVLFNGNTTTVSHIFDQPEIVTVLECGEGEQTINQDRIAVSYAANTPALTVLSGIASEMALNFVGPPPVANLVYRQGFKFIGMGKDALDLVCNKLNLQWSIQNKGDLADQLQVIPVNGTLENAIIQVNQTTGMQGIPQRFTYKRQELFKSTPTTGYKVNVALNPYILPGSRIDLASYHLNFRGPYRVETVRHEGDTFGNIWTSNLETTEIISGPTL